MLAILNHFGQYADVRRELWNTAESLGAKMIPKTEISSLDVDKEGRPSVRLASGEILEADVIVGTDGPDSIARKEVIGQDVKETTLGLSVFRSETVKAATCANGY